MMMIEVPYVMMMLVILAHTGALFYWGGSIHQMLKDHDRRITRLEEKR